MNRSNEIDQVTLDGIQDLIRTNLVSRDSLYAAAENLDNETLKKIYRRLANELGGHVADLEQFLLMHHAQPVGPDDKLVAMLTDIVLEELQQNSAPVTALQTGEKCAQQLKKQYEETIEKTEHQQAQGILHQQRETVESGEEVLRALGDLKQKSSR